MISVKSFEEEIAYLRNYCKNNSFHNDKYCYDPNNSKDPKYYSRDFNKITRSHFREKKCEKEPGVYIISIKDTGEVLYIGMTGTLERKDDGSIVWQGQGKEQGLMGRLTNTRKVPIPKMVQNKKKLRIEYFCLTKSKSPGFVEKALLQAYFNTYCTLPRHNDELK